MNGFMQGLLCSLCLSHMLMALAGNPGMPVGKKLRWPFLYAIPITERAMFWNLQAPRRQASRTPLWLAACFNDNGCVAMLRGSGFPPAIPALVQPQSIAASKMLCASVGRGSNHDKEAKYHFKNENNPIGFTGHEMKGEMKGCIKKYQR